MPDAWRAYLEMALGLTEAPRKRAQKVAGELLTKGGATAGQLQGLVEDLVTTSASNREALTNLVRYEVDRALGRVGLATAEEVAELTARLKGLEKELAEARGDVTLAEPGPAAVVPPAPAPVKKVAKKAVAKKAPPAGATTAATTEAAPVTTAEAAPVTPATVAVKKAAPAKKAPAKKAAKAAPGAVTPATVVPEPEKAVPAKATKIAKARKAAPRRAEGER